MLREKNTSLLVKPFRI